MTVTRRRFIQCALAMGSSLRLPLRTESSQPSKTEPWPPACERLQLDPPSIKVRNFYRAEINSSQRMK